MNKIRVFEAFSGIGAQAMALKRLQAEYPDVVEFEFVGTSEIEPSAIKAYNTVHGDVECYGDITKIDWDEVPDFDLFTMSSPCQDFSVAGRQAGAEEGSGTRSSLLWECRKAIIAKKPRYILFENVSAVVSKKFIRGFNKWQSELESYGYTNFAKVLNSKDFGIPQNRERIFMVSIWGGQSYHFPEPFKLEKRIKDILEPYGTVDESFYFSAKQLSGMFKYCAKKKDEGCGFQTQFTDENGIASCVTTRYGASYTDAYLKEPAIQQRLSLYGNNAQAGRVYDVEGIAPCLDTCCGGNRMPKILTPVRTEEAKELRRKGIEVFKHRELVPREDGISNTITTVTKDNMLVEPCILGYTRDDNGKVCDRHDKEIANTVHTSTGNGGNTDQFVKEPIDRQSKIRSKVMPNGNIRFYQDDESKSGISEMQIIHPENECPTITTAHVPKILEPVIIQRPHGFNDGWEFSEYAPTVTTSSWEHNCFCKEPMVGNDPRRIFGKDDFRSDMCGALMAVDYKAPKLVKEPIELSFDNLPDETVLKDEDGKGYLWQDGSLWRVRKLVPIEVFRLQDVSDEDAKKIIAVCSKSACYQLAGNSITCAVLYHIFRKLWIDTENESAQKSLFDL